MPFAYIFLALAAMAAMGGNFVASKIALQQFGPYFFNALRFMATALLLLPWLQRPLAMTRPDLLLWAMLFALNFSLGMAAMGAGLDVSTAILLIQLSVPVACLIGAVWQGDRLGPWRLSGLAIAFLGLCVVAGTPSAIAHPAGFLLALVGAVVGGAFNASVKGLQLPAYPFLAWMSLFSVPVLLALSALAERGQTQAFLEPHPAAWAALAYAVIVNTLFAHGAWYFLLGRNQISEVAPFSLLVPVFGIFFAQAWLGESLSPEIWLGGTLTLLGVGVIVLRRPKLAVQPES